MCIADKLQIILITYNREKYLKNTMEQLFSDISPVKNCSILVMDNNSTDNTKQIVKEFKHVYSNLEYQKNKYNVGISGNIAKAIESASKEYAWIIADDDKFDWSNWKEIEEALNNDEEIIYTGNQFMIDNSIESILYQSTFISTTIFKTSLLNDTILRNVVDTTFTLFPHLTYVIDFINSNKKIYIPKTSVIIYNWDGIADMSYTRGVIDNKLYRRTSTMTFLVGYANICSLLSTSKLKNDCLMFAIKQRYGNFYRYCKELFNLYFNHSDLYQIMDVYSVLNIFNKLLLIFYFITVPLFSCCLFNNKIILRFLFFKFIFILKKFNDNENKFVVYKFIKVSKNIKNNKKHFYFWNKKIF